MLPLKSKFKQLVCVHKYSKWHTPTLFFDFPAKSYRQCTKCGKRQVMTSYRSGLDVIENEK